ncbi:class I SAM-dependent methyltransferase [Spirulina sp. CS-785/01]|uniref:class I SAM-dependent methyltransferase n=1 Tax=Spirulina sp. CS-785/01 TaxID=3021716 RepID=UPI00232F0EB6|nr:class I SAM-dependent methyltransferase [Spirulina sp. CS-785/01]MDB9313817.1 class I SAM-dependent methyltransferase [Spirulina sp. CS-785/01]
MNDLDSLLNMVNSKDLNEKKSWYSSVAQAYHYARPRYPQDLLQHALTLAQLPPHAPILEVGCGPGTATATLASFGLPILALEPSLEACQLAQDNCHTYPNVEIINTTFEEWQPQNRQFAALIASTSFHWLAPETRCQKAAQLLQPDGSLILLWNTPPQPSPEVAQTLQPLYDTYAPSLSPYIPPETHVNFLQQLGQTVLDSGHFKNLQFYQCQGTITYPIDKYLILLSTLSPYIALDPDTRDILFQQMQATLKQHWGNSLSLSSLIAFHVAQVQS